MGERTLQVGDPVVVVEHDEATRAPLEGGRQHRAEVVRVEGIYVQVTYEDRALNGGRPDAFYAESLWRAWDGALRWRLTTKEGNHGRT